MTNVVAPKAFQARIDEDTLKRLEAMGVILEDTSGFDDLPLTEPKYGEEVIGELTDEETRIFVSFYRVNEELTALNREIGGGLLESIGRDMKAGKVPENEVYEVEDHVEPDQAKVFFRLACQRDYLKALLYFTIGERLDCYEWHTGIRSKKRVVRTEKRY